VSDDAGDEVPEIDNAADPVKINKRRREIKDKRKLGDQFWQRVLNDVVGRQELWGLFSESHAFESRFACGPNGSPQSEATWFQLGEQMFGLRIYQRMLQLDPKAVAVMHEENDPRFAQKVK